MLSTIYCDKNNLTGAIFPLGQPQGRAGRAGAGFITNPGQKNKIDHLTGLGNKIKFAEDIQTVLQRRPVRPVRLVLAEPDGFPLIHELYTRLFGDEVLRIMAQRIQSMLPPHATVYRLNGNEFGIIVKVGPTFLHSILTDAFGATFIRCIVELCHTAGTAACLQGVEQKAEWRKILPLHPDRLQGFFFGRPMAADVFTRTLLL